MDPEDFSPVLFIAVLIALGLAWRALRNGRRVRAELAALSQKFTLLDERVALIAERLPASQMPGAEELSVAPAEAEAPPEPDIQPTAAAEPVLAVAEPIPAAVAAARWPLERILVEHWLVWAGAATLALGGAFLVKLSIDYGLITPVIRVVLAALLGLGLSAGAEFLSRREGQQGEQTLGISYVPQALAAAGAATLFAAIYAAYALYELLPSSIAFVLLAAIAGGAVAQSLRQGPLVAALGLVGAYAVPLLVSSNDPAALPLFLYLAVVTAASLALLRHREWTWLAWLSLAGSIGWALLWLAAAVVPATPIVASYLALLFGMVVAFRHGVPRIVFLSGTIDSPMVRAIVRTGLWALALAVVFLANADHFGSTSLVFSILAVIALMGLAYRDSQLDDTVAIAASLALVLLATWNLPLPAPEMALWVFRVEPDHLADFSTAAIAFVGLLGAGGFVLLPRVARPGRWAAPSALVPLAVLVIAYWRLQKFELSIAWTLAGLALAGLNLLAAAAVAKRRSGAFEIELALAAYAVAVLGSTIFAATMALGEAWLTVALALHLPGLGWIEKRIRIPVLRWLALGVAGLVLIRLLLNPYVLSYPLGETPIFNWLLYGYGLPALAFIVATKQFGSSKDDALVWVLEAGSILFTLSLLSLELVHALEGSLSVPIDDFAHGAALLAVWMVFAAVLFALGEWRQRPVLLWGGRLILGSATVTSILWQPVMLLFGVSVGNLAFFDALLLAEAVPALVFAIVAWVSPGRPIRRVIMRVLAAFFAFAWVSLEVRHIFQGKVGLFASSSEAEWYAYSVAWLLFAAALLAGGLIWRNAWLRQAGLIGLAVVIAKVFLSDMAELSGVLRAFSFIGLGGALVGIGYAYRRLQPFPDPNEAEPNADSAVSTP